VVGGVIGGIIGSQINRPYYEPAYPQPYYQQPAVDPVAYCIKRFRSYNPATGLYLGFDRQYHRCP